eukprot:10889910-Alexandrium_andersonii.AAC.1
MKHPWARNPQGLICEGRGAGAPHRQGARREPALFGHTPSRLHHNKRLWPLHSCLRGTLLPRLPQPGAKAK